MSDTAVPTHVDLRTAEERRIRTLADFHEMNPQRRVILNEQGTSFSSWLLTTYGMDNQDTMTEGQIMDTSARWQAYVAGLEAHHPPPALEPDNRRDDTLLDATNAWPETESREERLATTRRVVGAQLAREYGQWVDGTMVAMDAAMDLSEDANLAEAVDGAEPNHITAQQVAAYIRDQAPGGSPLGEFGLRVRRQDVLNDLQQHYRPVVPQTVLDIAIGEAEQENEDAFAADGGAYTISAGQVARIIRENTRPGSPGAVYRLDTQAPDEDYVDLADMRTQIGPAVANMAALHRLQGIINQETPTVPQRMTKFEKRVGEMLIDLVGSTNDEDLAKNADLSIERVKEIMGTIDAIITQRSTNR